MAVESSACTGPDPFGNQVNHRLRSFIRTESGSAGILVLASLIALLWANSPWSHAYVDLWHTVVGVRFGTGDITMSLHHWVNDGLMVVFFFVIGLEVRREFSVGELTDPRRVVIPLVAGVGGMVVPTLIYLLLNPGGEAARGWGMVIGTDTAFLLGALALVGPAVSTQLRIFLLTLTVIDDIVAVSVIGLVYSDHLSPWPIAIGVLSLLILVVMGRLGVWRAAPYVLVVLVLWVATLESGLHASIAGMLAGLLIPAVDPRRADVERAADRFRAFRQSPMPSVQRLARRSLDRAISVNERLQEGLHGATSFVVVPVFALANAGVDLRGGLLGEALVSPVTWGVAIGLVAGKTVGIGTAAWAAVRLGWGRLPQGVGMGHAFAGAALSGIGFTVSLLIANLAFDSDALREQAVVGVLLSAALACLGGWLAFRFGSRVLGEGDAALPRVLSDPVDPAVDHVRGDPESPVVLVEYLDFECPFCARVTGGLEQVRRHFGDRLLYVQRHLPLDVHPHAIPAALAAEAAARQGSYWQMHDLLFNHQAELEVEDLAGYAADLGLDVEQFLRDLDEEGQMRRVQRDIESAEASGVRGTPTFFVQGVRHVGPHDAGSLIAALENADPRLGEV